MRTIVALAVLASTSVALGQLVAPTFPDAESSLTSGINTAIRNAPRAYQEYMAPGNFTTLPGGAGSFVATGMQLRLAIGENWRPVGYVGSSWPDAAINFADYEIRLSKATPQLITDGEYLSTVPTFASYQDGGLTLVHDGPLTIPANCFTADGGATGIHSFGCTIPFSTPYTINAGDSLVLEIRHSGYGATGTPLNAFFGTHDFLNGTADAISSTVSQTAAAPSGFSSPYYVRFVPEPSTLVLCGLGALSLIRRKR